MTGAIIYGHEDQAANDRSLKTFRLALHSTLHMQRVPTRTKAVTGLYLAGVDMGPEMITRNSGRPATLLAYASLWS